MKRILRLTFLALGITSLVFSTTGCRRKKTTGADVTGGGEVVIPDVGTQFPGDGTSTFLPDDSALAARIDGAYSVVPTLEPVYFDYDRSDVRGSELAKIDNAAAYFQQTTGVAIMVEGHTDERGSNEYNLGLGERRALAIRDALIGRGIDAARIQTLSKGEEFPASMGHDEGSWSRNRRGEFLQGQ